MSQNAERAACLAAGYSSHLLVTIQLGIRSAHAVGGANNHRDARQEVETG